MILILAQATVLLVTYGRSEIGLLNTQDSAKSLTSPPVRAVRQAVAELVRALRHILRCEDANENFSLKRFNGTISRQRNASPTPWTNGPESNYSRAEVGPGNG